MAQSLRQTNGQIVQIHAAHDRFAEHLCGGLVGQQHFLPAPDYKNAGTHALDDQLVELFQAGEAGCLLVRQAFRLTQAFADALHEERHGEIDTTQNAYLKVALRRAGAGQAQVKRQVDDNQTGQRREQKPDAAMQQNVAGGHRYEQQIAKTATGAARCIENAAQQENIEHREDEQMHIALALMQQQRNKDIYEQVEPTGHFIQLGVVQIQQPVSQPATGQYSEKEAKNNAIDIIDAQDARALIVDDLSHVAQRRGAHHSNTSGHLRAAPDPGAGAVGIARSGPSAQADQVSCCAAGWRSAMP